MNQTMLCLLLTALCGCNGAPQQPATPPTDARQEALDATETVTTTAVAVDAVRSANDTLRASLTKAAPVTLNARLDSLHATVLCAVQTGERGTLTAEITPEHGTGNIRFSQLYLPDGSTDGPFGQSLTYTLTQAGTFRLRISPSQMANDPYRGKFKLTLTLN